MRPLELLVIAAGAAGLLVSLAPSVVPSILLRLVPPVALLTAVVQLLVERPRWQLVPAYALAVVVAAGSAWRGRNGATADLGQRARWTAAAVGVAWLGVAVSLPLLMPIFRFPIPRGPHGVGTLTYSWVDERRLDPFDGGRHRELMVQLWYPATPSPSAPRAPYLDDPAALEPLARLLRLPPFVLGHLGLVRTNAVRGAPAVDGVPSFPVLIFSPGRGGYRQHDTLLVEALASSGYVVAAIDHPGAAAGVDFPDGRRVTFDARMADDVFVDGMVGALAEDVRFVVAQLEALNRSDPSGVLSRRLDLDRLGVLGLSLGGEVAAEACLREPRLRACLAMDVWMPPTVVASGLNQPLLLLTRDAASMRLEGWSPAAVARTLGTMRAVLRRSPGSVWLLQEPGMFHADFSDASLFSPLTRRLGITGPIDPARAREVVAGVSTAFFDAQLRGRSGALDGLTARFPELLVERSH
jgi:predicted dienelactone hydrolase